MRLPQVHPNWTLPLWGVPLAVAATFLAAPDAPSVELPASYCPYPCATPDGKVSPEAEKDVQRQLATLSSRYHCTAVPRLSESVLVLDPGTAQVHRVDWVVAWENGKSGVSVSRAWCDR